MSGFIKLNRDEVVEELLKDHKTWALFSLIAYRARYKKSFSIDGLQVGEALIGDIETIGLTPREYRTSKEKLVRWQFVTIRTTNRGTIARLTETSPWSVCNDTKGQAERQARDKQETTNKKDKKEEEDIAALVIDYFNLVTGTSFKATTANTVKLINARVKDGATIEVFKKVIDTKSAEWLNDSQMSRHLSPDTLFSESKFEKYLNQTVKKTYPVNESMTGEQVYDLFQ